MPKTLTDLEAAELAPFRALRGDPASRHFVAEGETAVLRLLASGHEVELLLCTDAHWRRLEEHITAARRSTLPVRIAEREQLCRLLGFDFHRGCLASGPLPRPSARIDDLTLQALGARDRSIVVLAEGLADPANLGTLMRNARAFAVDLMLVDARAASPWSRRAIRGSMGHVFALPMVVCHEPRSQVRQLVDALGYQVLAATADRDATPLPRAQFHPNTLLMVGNEGHGLSAGLMALADERVTIPIDSEVDSLNVASASAVLLHALDEARKRR